MKLTKRLFSLLLALLMASACFVGCSSDNNADSDNGDDKDTTSAEIENNDQNGKDEIIKDDTTAEDTTAAPDINPPHEHNYANGACTVCGKAEPKPSEGLEYTLNYDGESYSVSGRGRCQDAHIVIPATYNGKPVTTIGKEAFTTNSRGEYHGDKLLTEVTIPDSVTRIEERAFENCTSLVSITIPNSVTDIGLGVFIDCTSLKYNEYNNGKYLGNSNNPYLFLCGVIDKTASSFDMHADTKIIITSAFSFCTSLTSITIPDGVTHISPYAFNGCASLTSITIPDSVTFIGWVAFSGCTSLTSITIPDSVTFIGGSAFSGCTSLTSITVPFVGERKDGTGETSFNYIFGFNVTAPTSLKTVIITGGSSIGYNAFKDCTSLTSIAIPDSVTSIGAWAFSGCTSLTSISIPDSVTSIDFMGFGYCQSLTSITFNGTKAQWKAINKGVSWDGYTGDYTVHCTDGDIAK